jgi:hypothetical protein
MRAWQGERKGGEEEKKGERGEGCAECEGEVGWSQKEENREKKKREKGDKVGHRARGEWLWEDKDILSSQSDDATWQREIVFYLKPL